MQLRSTLYKIAELSQ